jgi:hypothetical protein
MLSSKYSDPNKIEEMSKQPAALRNNTDLDNIVYSKSTQMSEYYLGSNNDDDDTTILKKENSYIHPNID